MHMQDFTFVVLLHLAFANCLCHRLLYVDLTALNLFKTQFEKQYDFFLMEVM